MIDADRDRPVRVGHVEREERTAGPLNVERLREQIAVQRRSEADDDGLLGPLDSAHGLGQPAVARLLRVDSGAVESAARNIERRLVEAHAENSSGGRPSAQPSKCSITIWSSA